MMRLTETVKQLLIINIIFFIASNTIAPVANEWLSLHFPLSDGFHWWQPLTHMFMHGSVMHIAFNMFGLYMFGSTLEHYWGWKKFLFFYISCGLGAALVHMGVEYYQFNQGLEILLQNGMDKNEIFATLNEGKYDTRWQNILSPDVFNGMVSSFLGQAVGASGALYGIIVAFAFMFPNAELMLLFLPIPIKAKYFVPVLVGFDLFMGLKGESIFGGGGIAHFAHVGGALCGFLMMWFWKKNQFNKNRWD